MFNTILGLLIISFSTLAYPHDHECPQPDEQNRYIETKTFPNEPARKQKMSIFYFLTSAFDKAKPTLVYLNGGPGDYSMPGKAWSHKEYNVVYMHHRGVGCSKPLGDIRASYREPLYSIDHAVEDLEEIRKDLLGSQGRWFVYGISYGGILAQAYSLKYQDKLEGLILDSTIYASSQITFAREQFFKLFFPAGDPISSNLNQLFARYPDFRIEVLILAVYSNSFLLRGKYFPRLIQDLLDLPTRSDALALLQKFKTPIYPKVGMAREITCREMWDFPVNDPNDEYYLPGFTTDCLAFKEFQSPFDFSRHLANLKIKTMIWSGKYDPVTPAASMQRMNAWIKGSLLLENQFAGHGIIREKSKCANSLLSVFHKSSNSSEIEKVMGSDVCQSAPEVPDDSETIFFNFKNASF